MASSRLREHIDLFDDPPWKPREATPDQQNPPLFVESATLATVISVLVLVVVFLTLGVLAWVLAHLGGGV
jgi:hypothetical protein